MTNWKEKTGLYEITECNGYGKKEIWHMIGTGAEIGKKLQGLRDIHGSRYSVVAVLQMYMEETTAQPAEIAAQPAQAAAEQKTGSKANRAKKPARASKRAVYEKYGLQYRAGKIYCEYLRAWLRPVLVNGNEKLGKGVWTFSTLAGNKLYSFTFEGVEYTAVGTCCCNCPGCYAQTGCFRFPSVIRSLGIKTMLARFNRDFLRRAILAQIEADHVETLRIHAAGDFFSMGYIAMWHDIIESTPAVKYWSYTKYAPAEHAFDDLPNMNMVPSLIPGAGMNYGRCGYVLQQVEKLRAQGERVHVCRCGVDAGQHCAGCKGCSENKYVLFIEHSTAYRAEEDPDFIPLRQLIEMQGRR